MSNKTTTTHGVAEPWWGLQRDITPYYGARLVQEGNRLHYLADRASIIGTFSEADLCHLEQAFPVLLKQLENMLRSGELNPRCQHQVKIHLAGLTCVADTRASCGYVYISIYPTQ